MIGYITLGSNQLAESARFYDALFDKIGASRVMDSERFIAWGKAPGSSVFSLIKPYDGQAATVGNGAMVALKVDSPQQVDAMHAHALALGASDEGAPGLRQGTFYCAYFRDLEGHKLNFFTYAQAED